MARLAAMTDGGGDAPQQYTYDPTQMAVVPIEKAKVVTYVTTNPNGLPSASVPADTAASPYNVSSTAGDELLKKQAAIDAANAMKTAADKAAADKLAADKAAADAAAAKKKAEDAKAASDANPGNSADAKVDQEAAITAQKAADEAKAAADKLIADAKIAADKATAEKIAADKTAADKIAADKITADKLAADGKLTAEQKTVADAKAAADAATAASTKVAADKAVADKIATDKATADKATAATTAATEQNRQSIITILTDRFNKFGLGSLATKIRDLAVDGASEATITIGLQETEEYKTRFSANTDRLNKGLKVLSPAEYLNLEDGYRQILRSYGLKQFDTDSYVKQFISNDVSAAELSDRVVTAVQRVQNADPAISQTLRDYYGIGNADMVAYVLDPNQQLQKIQRQVAAAEVGTAARVQGLEPGVAVSEQLAAQGISQAEAQKGYATIANILPTAEKLSEIYGGTMQKYGQTEGEQEVFNSLASAQRAREKLSAREIAQFQGSAGVNKTSLASQTRGAI